MASLGDLVTNLTVNNTGFKAGLSSATTSLRIFAGSVGGIVAPIAGALGAVWGTSAAISGYKTSLENQRKFQSVLEATGGAAGVTAAEMAEMASALQSVTNFEDDATMGAAALLASFDNIRGENFGRAIELAQDMATVMNVDLDSAVKKMGKSFKDLSTDEVTEKLDEMQSRFGGAAKAVADPWKQLQNTLGDVGENIGSALLPTINVMSESLTSLFGVVAEGTSFFKTFGIEAAVTLSHVGSLIELLGTQFALFVTQIGANAAHLFTSVIPTYLEWFGNNWSSVLLTAADYAATIFINLGTNIRNLWQTVLDFFKTGAFEFNWTPLTEGFKNSISELPNVPIRAVTEFEQGLKDSIDAQTAALEASMDAQRAELEAKFSPLGKTAPEFVEDDEESAKKTSIKAERELKGTEALSQGSSAALSAIYGANRNQTPEKQLKVAEQTLAESRRQTAKLDMIASREPDVIGVAIG